METVVYTPTGPRLLGDIETGDRVCNPDGTVSTVIATHDIGERDFYRVTLNDGSHVDAAADHVWVVAQASKRKRRKVPMAPLPDGLAPDVEWNARVMGRYRRMTTAQLAELLRECEEADAADRPAYWPMLPLTNPVAFTRTPGRWPLLPAYTLGVLLGDGSTASNGVTWHKPEPQIAVEVAADLARTDLGLTVNSLSGAGDYSIVGGAQKLLRRVGLMGKGSHERFIPEQYKHRPAAERFALVQGLMDTDGYADERGHLEYVTTSQRLAEDMQWMLRSLGFTAKVGLKEEPAYVYDGERRIGRPAWRLYIRGAQTDRLFRLHRKRDRCRPYNGGAGDALPGHRVVSVAPTGRDLARCITVDHPNGLYVTDDFIVTHNSSALLMAALQYADIPGYAALILRRTYRDLALPGALMDRAMGWLAPTDAHWRAMDGEWKFPSGARLAFGYLQHDNQKYRYQCFEPGTELLTEHGWRDVALVEAGDQCATLDPETRELEYKPAVEVQTYDFDGELVEVHQRKGVSFAVTPNHTIWHGLYRDESGLRACPAEALPRMATVPQWAKWSAPDPPHRFRLEPLKKWGSNRSRSYDFAVEDWAEFLGWYVAEGSCADPAKGSGCRYTVAISQNAGENQDRIAGLLHLMGFNPAVDARSVRVAGRALCEHLRPLGKAVDKRLPGYVLGWPRRLQRILLNALVEGDGTWRTPSSGHYVTASKELMDQVCELAVKAGFRPTACLRQGNPPDSPYGTRPRWHVSLLELDHDTLIGPTHRRRYQGPVHCVTVPPYHTVLTRRRGRVSWSGQSAEFQFIGFDELSQFSESQYRYMFSRLRRPEIGEHSTAPQRAALESLSQVPLRMRTACVDEGEVLTQGGWKPIQDVEVGEAVYSVDRRGRMALKPVTGTHRYRHEGPIVRIRGKGRYMSFTPEHRILYRKSGKETLDLARWIDHTGRSVNLVRAPSSYEAPGFSQATIGPVRGVGELYPLPVTDDAYLAFLGLFLSEGCTNTPRRGNYKVVVTQTKEPSRAAVRELMGQLPVNVSESAAGDFQITNQHWWNHCRPFGKAHEKHVPRSVLEAADGRQLRLLFDWLVFGDGHVRGGHVTYSTVSPQLRDDVAEIGVKLGYKVKLGLDQRKNPRHRDRYAVYLLPGQVTRVEKNEARNDVDVEPYEGEVHCLTVADNETFVIRQQGSVWVSGNSNPGGVGHEWVRERFVDQDARKTRRVFVPAGLNDNPHLDTDTYTEALEALDPVTRAQLMEGDWEIRELGGLFDRAWFPILEDEPVELTKVRYWDLAGTIESRGGGQEGSDWTAGCLLGRTPHGRYVILDMHHHRGTPHSNEERIRQVAQMDGPAVSIFIEQEGGHSGIALIDRYVRHVLPGFTVHGDRPTGSKVVRAGPVSSMAESGNVAVVRGNWLPAFWDELEGFPAGPHDDQCDALSGAFSKLATRKRPKVRRVR